MFHMQIIKCRLLTAYGTSDWASNATNGIAKIIRRAVIGLIFPRTWKAAKMQAIRDWVVRVCAFDAWRRLASAEHHANAHNEGSLLSHRYTKKDRILVRINMESAKRLEITLTTWRHPDAETAAPRICSSGLKCTWFTMFIVDARKMRF